MKHLLDAAARAAKAAVPASFRWMLSAGFRDVEGCVFLRELFHADDASALPSFKDATGFESSINKLHLDKLLDTGTPRDPTTLAGIAMSSARELGAKLRTFSNDEFRIIVTVDGKHSTIRFHKIREGESWLVDDLEAYGEAVLVLDAADLG